MKSEELLNLQGFKQSLYSIAMSNTNVGVLTSFGTTIIITIDWKKVVLMELILVSWHWNYSLLIIMNHSQH